jgi:hypothetical protein
MAQPPSFYPVKNKTCFFHVNWTWAPPGTQGNICEQCGTHCFCAAKQGLLPKTRSALVAVHPQVVVEQQGLAIEHDAVALESVAAPLDGLAAILQYDSD